VLTNNVNFLDLLGLRNVSMLNLTVNNQIQIGAGTIMAVDGISNAENIMGTYYSQAYNTRNPASTTCGIQEAENAVPSTGGVIVMPPGNCNFTSDITISKPTILLGQGGGGYLDSSTFTTFSAPTILVKNGTASLKVVPAAGTTLSGVTFKNFAITSNAASGDLIVLGNPASTTAYLRNVAIQDMTIYKSLGFGLKVAGNLQKLNIDRTEFDNNTSGGFTVSNVAGVVVDALNVTDSAFQHNSGDGVTLDCAGVNNITFTRSYAINNGGSGLSVSAISTVASAKAYQSRFYSNGVSGWNLLGGNAYFIESSEFLSNTPYGVNLTTTGVGGTITLSAKDTRWSLNSTADFHTGSAVPYVIWYPQLSQTVNIVEDTVNTLHYILPSTIRASGTNGFYRIDSDGTITNWISIASLPNDNTYHDYTLPHAFTTAMMAISCVVDRPGGNPGPLGGKAGTTNASIQLLSNTGGAGTFMNVTCIAVGY